MPTKCVIQLLDNDQRVYYAGDLLRGTLSLSLTSEKSVRGVYVEVNGKAYAHWTESETIERNGKRETITKSYTGEEIYLRDRTHFIGGTSVQSGCQAHVSLTYVPHWEYSSVNKFDSPSQVNVNRGSISLKPGTYNHSFQCRLPGQLPTSVNGEYGYIQYSVRVVLDIPFWPDKEFSVGFTVIKAINLNVEPGMREPILCEKVKTFSPCGFLCCWESEPLRIVTRTPVAGYVPGQQINLTISIYNESDERVVSVEACLVKNITFYARLDGCGERHTRETQDVIQCRSSDERCAVKQNKVIRLNLEVPAIPPTDCSTSTVIQVRYYIKVVAQVDGCCSSNPKLSFPVTIGTYPILDNIVTQPVTQQPKVQLSNPSIPEPSAPQPTAPPDSSDFTKLPYPTPSATPSAPPLNDPSCDPPTYEEAVGGNDSPDNSFKPKYPMFRRQTSYSNGDFKDK